MDLICCKQSQHKSGLWRPWAPFLWSLPTGQLRTPFSWTFTPPCLTWSSEKAAAIKQNNPGLNTHLFNWVSDFLTSGPQTVPIGNHTSITHYPWSPSGLCACPPPDSNIIIKFADDLIVLGLTREEDEKLERWSRDIRLMLYDLWMVNIVIYTSRFIENLWHANMVPVGFLIETMWWK